MSSHILDPLLTLARALRSKPAIPATRHPLDGMPIPEQFIGKHFDVRDADGTVVATTRRPPDPLIGGMLG